MSDLDLTEMVDALRCLPPNKCGFDDQNGWEHPRTWDRAAGNPEMATRAILAVAGDICGYHASSRLDLDDDRDRQSLRWIAEQLEQVAAALRSTLDNRAGDGES